MGGSVWRIAPPWTALSIAWTALSIAWTALSIAWTALGIALVWPAASRAQEESEPRPIEPPGRALEEIIVTAQKTEQSIQDVPISISVLQGELLRDTNLTTFDEIAYFLPNAQVVDYGLAPIITIRGFSTAATAVSRGVEIDATWLPGFAPWLTVLGGGAFLDARYTDYKEGPPKEGSDAVSQDLSGKPLAPAPKWSGFLAPAARLPISALPLVPDGLGWELGLGLDVTYRSNHFLEIALNPEAKQNAYALMNGRLSLAREDRFWALTLNVRNLADERVLQSQFADQLFPGSFYGLANRGRQMTLDLAFQW